MEIHIGERVAEVQLVEKEGNQVRKDDGRQDDTITAAMPGKIVKINVAAGDRVTDGDTLIVFEAMKMQSNLKVVGDCTVREVLVCEGDPVATGQPLIKLDILTNDQNNE